MSNEDMYVDVGKRDSGKTTKLINWLLENWDNRILLVHTQQMATNLLGDLCILHPELNIIVNNGPQKIMSIEDGIKYRRIKGRKEREIRIDGIEVLLGMLDFRINGFSLNRNIS